MKYRVFAFFVLIVLVGIPILLYWFFATKQVSSLQVYLSEGIPFSVHLQGKLSYSLLPLADKILDFQLECIRECTITPIPPVDYSVRISALGMDDITDSLHFSVGEKKILKYQFIPNITLVPNTENASELSQTFTGIYLLKQLSKSRFLGFSYASGELQLGIVSDGTLTPFKVFSDVNLQSHLDMSHEYILVGNPLDSFTEIYDSLGKFLLHVPFPENEILSVSLLGNEWKIKTKSSVYSLFRDSMIENPRFTDFVDISSQYRIGYIDKNDTKRRMLANLTDDSSFLVLLDRYSGNATYKKITESLQTCFLRENIPVCIGTEGSRFILQIGK